jgi:hypothetical protein
VSLQQAQLNKKLADASKKAKDFHAKNQKWKETNCLHGAYKAVDPEAQEEISQSSSLALAVNRKRVIKYHLK